LNFVDLVSQWLRYFRLSALFGGLAVAYTTSASILTPNIFLVSVLHTVLAELPNNLEHYLKLY
jgi:hypothetical protein